MGFRRSAVVLATAAAALLATPAAGAAPPPHVELGRVGCHDLSGLISLLPEKQRPLDAEAGKVANVPVTVRGVEGSGSVPFTVTADGQRKAQGTVGPGGTVVTGVSVPRDDDVRIVVRSHHTVLLDRTLFVSCEDGQRPTTKPVPENLPALELQPVPDDQPWWPFDSDKPSPLDWLPDFLR